MPLPQGMTSPMRRALMCVTRCNCRSVKPLYLRTSASATLDGEWAVPLCAFQEVWEWPCTQALYTAAISLGGCVQGVCTRVARVGERCAVVWLASEWHRVVCAVCVAHGTQGGPLFMHKVPVSHCPA